MRHRDYMSLLQSCGRHKEVCKLAIRQQIVAIQAAAELCTINMLKDMHGQGWVFRGVSEVELESPVRQGRVIYRLHEHLHRAAHNRNESALLAGNCS